MHEIDEMIKHAIQSEKEITRFHKELQKKITDLTLEEGKICLKLHNQFVANNWDSLDRSKTYYKVFLEEKLVVIKVKFSEMIREDWAVFKTLYMGHVNTNLYKVIKQEDYQSNRVIIDENQLEFLSKYYELMFREC